MIFFFNTQFILYFYLSFASSTLEVITVFDRLEVTAALRSYRGF